MKYPVFTDDYLDGLWIKLYGAPPITLKEVQETITRFKALLEEWRKEDGEAC